MKEEDLKLIEVPESFTLADYYWNLHAYGTARMDKELYAKLTAEVWFDE